MSARTTPVPAEPSAGRFALRQVTFVLVTLAAFVLDALMTVPTGDELVEGHHWVAFGGWPTSLVTFLLLMFVLYGVLLLRRRFPLAVLAYAAVLSVTLTFTASYSQPMTGLLVCLYTAASLAETRWASRLSLALALAAMTASVLLNLGPGNPDAVFAVLIVGGISITVWLFGRRERLAHVTAAGLRDQLEVHGEEAARQERRRIARELHDILAHSVSAMMMQAAGAKAVTHGVRQDQPEDPRLDTVERALTTIENAGSQSMRELHRLLSALRGDEIEPEIPGESSSQPGLTDIERVAELTRQSGLSVELHTSGEVARPDPSVALAAYRVVQESLANAMKHAGRGGVVEVFHSWHDDRLQVQVRTRDGHEGALQTVHGSGTGLLGLRERVELMGGTFDSGLVGDEFVTTAVLPLVPSHLRPDACTDEREARPTGLAGLGGFNGRGG